MFKRIKHFSSIKDSKLKANASSRQQLQIATGSLQLAAHG